MATLARYGIVGYPVKHSFSPAMHSAAFAHLGIAATYSLFEKKPEELNDFLGRMRAEGVLGVNVTIPYKEKVLDFAALDEGSSYLRTVKAVNTLALRQGVWQGFNTDIPGFARHLKEHIDLAGKIVALLGAGGAARAVAYALAQGGALQVRIFDIDFAKAEDIAAMVKSMFPGFDIMPVARIEALAIAGVDILVNATPVGMKPQDPCLVKKEWLHPGLFVYDLIYNPAQTCLLAQAHACGATGVNGLKMLLYQGMLSFEIWTGQKAPQEIMQRALEEELKKCLKR